MTKMREKLREDFFDEDAYVEKPFRCTELSATEKENALKIAFMYKRKKELGTIPDNKQESVRQMLEHEWLEEKKKIITIPVSQEEHTGFSVTPQCEEPKIQETEIVSGQITTRQLINRDIKNNGANPMMFRESVVAKLVEEYKTQKINLNVQFPKEVLASTSYAERKEIKARLLKHYEDDPLAGLND